MPVVGDTVLLADQDSNAKQPETAHTLLWSDRHEVFSTNKFSRGCLILPEFVPDSQIPLILKPDALEVLVQGLSVLSKTVGSLDFNQTMQIVYLIKLLIL